VLRHLGRKALLRNQELLGPAEFALYASAYSLQTGHLSYRRGEQRSENRIPSRCVPAGGRPIVTEAVPGVGLGLGDVGG
jgi:hypothetical protein